MSDLIMKCPSCGIAKRPVSGSHYHHCGACPLPDPETARTRRQRAATVAARIREHSGAYTNSRFWHEPAGATDPGAPAGIAGHAFLLSMAGQRAAPLPGKRPAGRPGIARPVFRLPDNWQKQTVNVAILLEAMEYLMPDQAGTELAKSILLDTDPANDDPAVAVAMLEHYGATGVCDWELARRNANR